MSHGRHRHGRGTDETGGQLRALDLVLKCDATGGQEAVRAAVGALAPPEMPIRIFSAGIGPVTKSDIIMAGSGSGLVVGFNVGVAQRLEPLLVQYGVEVRLYEVIYRLAEELAAIARSLVRPQPEPEKILGSARVIALFKGPRRGIILGCEVREGELRVGQSFRVIAAMGPVYAGTIESMHIGRDAVQFARTGQQVGLQILGFNAAHVGDLVEAYQRECAPAYRPWTPKPAVLTP